MPGNTPTIEKRLDTWMGGMSERFRYQVLDDGQDEQMAATTDTMSRSRIRAETEDNSNDGFGITVSRVSNLASIDEEGETPAPHAIASALGFLTQTQQLLRKDFPKGATTVGDDGSINVYWRKLGHTVQLSIPADQQRMVSVYHRDGTDYSIEKNAVPQTLAYWLERFARA